MTDDHGSLRPVDDLRTILRSALTASMKRRDRIATSAVRSTIAALDNAEAIPADSLTHDVESPIAGAVSGLGSTEARRRSLTASEAAAIVAAELADLRANADGYRQSGQDERATELDAAAEALEAALAPDPTDDPAVARARALVDGAQRIVVLTGAGISTDSGIPDFRGPNGVWTRNPDAEKLSSIEHYLADPDIRRRAWLGRLDHPAWTSDSNAGHDAIVRLDRRHKLDLLVTQNIDGLHHASGLDPERIVEIHGSIREVECLSCGWRGPMQETLDRVRAGEADPACLVCGGILKSATISFGQGLVAADLERSFEAAEHCDLLIAVGTNLSVYPIANVVPLAVRAGAPVVIVNGSPTEMDAAATVIARGSISDVLPEICG